MALIDFLEAGLLQTFDLLKDQKERQYVLSAI